MPIINFPPVIGGAENQAYKLAQELSKIGVDVHIVTKSMSGRNNMRGDYSMFQSPVPSCSSGKFSTLVFGFYLFCIIILLAFKKKGKLVIHCFGDEVSLVNAYIADRLFNIPYVVKLSATIDDEYIDRYYAERRVMARLLCRLRDKCLRSAGKIIVQDELSMRLLCNKLAFSHDRIAIVKNGVVPGDEGIIEEKKIAMRARLRTGEFKILYVGRMEPHKGVINVIDAFNEIVLKYPKSILWLVGDGSQRAMLEQYVEETGNNSIVFWGKQNQTQDFYSKSDIFVIASYREGLPNALIEAMAYACIPVSTNVGGIAEIMNDDETGILIPTGNAHSITNAVMNLCSNINKSIRIAADAYRFVRMNLSMEENLRRHLEIYQAIIPK